MAIGAGSSDYKVYLATEESSGTPSGTYVTFLCDRWKKGWMTGTKGNPSIGGAAYRYPMGQRALTYTLTNCLITAQQKATATQEADYIEDFIETYSNESGANPLYLFLYHEADARYKYLAHYSGTHYQYFKCFVDTYDIVSEKGKIYKITSMRLAEWTN